MNPWDVFTWFCSAALTVSGVLIFAFFVRDARGILNRDLHQSDDESRSEDDVPS